MASQGRPSTVAHLVQPDRSLPTVSLLPLLVGGQPGPRGESTAPSLTCADSAQCLSAVVTLRRRRTAWRRHNLEIGVKVRVRCRRLRPMHRRRLDLWSGRGHGAALLTDVDGTWVLAYRRMGARSGYPVTSASLMEAC